MSDDDFSFAVPGDGAAPDDGSFVVRFGNGTRYDLDEIRRRKHGAFMPDGEHAWTISAVYALDDPEVSLDSMELGAENFVGVSAISCLICFEPYTTTNRHFKCPQEVARRPTITCQSCGKTSSHPKDVETGYCGNCHAFTDGPTP